MKLSLNLPILVSARPDGARTVRDIYLTSRREYEVLEYSLADCQVAYTLKYDDSRFPNHGRTTSLFSVGDRLFRRLGPVDQALAEYFTLPFRTRINEGFASQDVNVHFSGRTRLRRQLGLSNPKTWPNANPFPDDEIRDRTFLEDVIGGFADISSAEYGEAMLTTARAVSGLAIIDGDLWCETPPPCILVKLNEYLPGMYSVDTCADFARDAPCFHYGVSTRRFSFSDFDSAERYVHELAELTGKRKVRKDRHRVPEVARYGPPDDIHDKLEHVRRISRDLAYSCVTIAFQKPELVQSLTSDQLLLLDHCKTSLLEENYVLGVRFDVPDVGLDLLEIWRALGQPQPTQVLKLTTRNLLDRYLERTLEDTIPISFKLRPHSLEPEPRHLTTGR